MTSVLHIVTGGRTDLSDRALSLMRAVALMEPHMAQRAVVTAKPALAAMSGPFPCHLLHPRRWATSLWAEMDGADIVHIHDGLTTSGAIAAAVARSRRRRLVLGADGGPSDLVMTQFGGIALADLVIAPTEAAAAVLPLHHVRQHGVLPTPDASGTAEVTPSACGARLLAWYRGLQCGS